MKTKTKPCTLFQVLPDIWMIREDQATDLIYSEEDDGYYFQQGRTVSNVYPTIEDAVGRYKSNRITFK